MTTTLPPPLPTMTTTTAMTTAAAVAATATTTTTTMAEGRLAAAGLGLHSEADVVVAAQVLDVDGFLRLLGHRVLAARKDVAQQSVQRVIGFLLLLLPPLEVHRSNLLSILEDLGLVLQQLALLGLKRAEGQPDRAVLLQDRQHVGLDLFALLEEIFKFVALGAAADIHLADGALVAIHKDVHVSRADRGDDTVDDLALRQQLCQLLGRRVLVGEHETEVIRA
mmetsp:Transcript_10193/g.26242  ORF Transcript_10193/g.26242 Transcript_10193/m.26242 type:complete len:223 (-) Transcript_10193:1340-2008(-)